MYSAEWRTKIVASYARFLDVSLSTSYASLHRLKSSCECMKQGNAPKSSTRPLPHAALHGWFPKGLCGCPASVPTAL